jgi:hypothetical protein
MSRNYQEDVEQALSTREIIVLTDRMGIITWLGMKGITNAKILKYITPEQVAGKVVIGTVPNHVQVGSFLVGNISVPNLPRGRNIVDLSASELDQYNARIDFYWPVEYAGSV